MLCMHHIVCGKRRQRKLYRQIYIAKFLGKLLSRLSSLRGCLHDIGATFIPARVHSGSLLWLCIRLHDTNTKCHACASHTGASSPRFLCRSEIFIPARKFIPVSCKRDMTVRFISIKVSSILLHYKTRTPTNTALCKHGATFHLAPE